MNKNTMNNESPLEAYVIIQPFTENLRLLENF
jgi:hypothetical protein